MRLLALAHCKDGHSRAQMAKFLKVSRTSVNQWVQTFLKKGLKDCKRNQERVAQHSLTRSSENN
nr:helix-turn-helix domain-containing protein [Vibrio vulnificus]